MSRSDRQITVPQFVAMKQAGRKITMLTAYDYTMAGLLDSTGIEGILVGDSLAMVVQGHSNTLPVTLDEKKHSRTLQLLIADDLEEAIKEESLDSIEMTIKAVGARHLRVKINDRDVTPTQQSDSQLFFQSPPIVQGKNQVDLRLQDDPANAASRVTEVDVLVRFR